MYLVGPLPRSPPRKRQCCGSYLDMPRFASSSYSQPYLPGGRSNTILGYQSTLAACCKMYGSFQCTFCLCSCYRYLLHMHTHLMALFPGLPWWAGTRKIKPIWILVKQDSEWQWHQLGHMQVCTLLQTDNHISTPPLCFLQAGCPSCHLTNSIKTLKATS